ncbi:secreted phosphoprotein 24 [Parambassis ranga]|uniref:Secreted phosphoprotein 24 n=1 Tax=Parambassis ranga TaxID=210632 RepID=A0A6P7HRK0_9TELE|nr:secreted phosphoprotein 24 [Parambassis ranga]
MEMKSCVLLLSLLQALGCTGIPLYNPELESLADRGLQAALAEVNSAFAVSHLYRATRGSVTRVIPMKSLNTVDLLIVFAVRETVCAKTSNNNLQTCAFRPGFFVTSFSCSTRVRLSATSTQVVSLQCGHDSSSSSESSEEVYTRRRHQLSAPIVNTGPAPSAPPAQPGGSFQKPTVDIRPRGDTFSNYLE